MSNIQQVGTLPDGNLLVALPQSIFQDFTELLKYYQENEERKRQTVADKEFISTKEMAVIAKKDVKTIREWCKKSLAPAASKQGRDFLIEKNEAVSILESRKTLPLAQNSEQTPPPQEFLSITTSKKERKRKRITAPKSIGL